MKKVDLNREGFDIISRSLTLTFLFDLHIIIDGNS